MATTRPLAGAAEARRYRMVLEHLPQTAIVVFDHDLRLEVVTGPALGDAGLDAAEVEGQRLHDVVPGNAARMLAGHYRRALAGEYVSLDYRSILNGRAFWLQVVPLLGEDGKVTGGMAVSLEITERMRVEEELRRSEERFRKAFDGAPIGMALLGLDGRLQKVNSSLCEITGYQHDDLVGMSLASLGHQEDAERQNDRLHRLVHGEKETHGAEMRVLHCSGQPIPIALHAALMRDADGEPEHLLLQIQDITERKRFEEQLQFMVDHDPLTGLLNRRGFEHELERHISGMKRYGAEGAMLALDLDHFKLINDTLGHNSGDKLISSVATVLSRRLRATDVVARLGGDEFAVLLPRATEEEAATLAQALIAGVREEEIRPSLAQPSHITVSVGVAVFGDLELTGEEMLIRADLAMYQAKQQGRDRHVCYTRGHRVQPRMPARPAWVDRIRAALHDDRFLLHAQPMVALSPDRPSMYELLLRMLDENGEVIFPSSFLHVAERFDLIGEIDRWVVRQAIGLLGEATAAGRAIPLSVNVSATSLAGNELLELIEELLSSHRVASEMLVFEVDETAAIANIQSARRFAERLHELGCRLALDDFGSAFGSFYYLKHLSFDLVKIDGEFVTGCLTSQIDQLLIEGVVSFARGLGKLTIAELTPDQPTLDFLSQRGVNFSQSHFTGPPVPLAQTALLGSA